MIGLHEVRLNCALVAERRSITVSEHAQILITDLLNAIIVDPYPSWHLDKVESLDAAARRYLQELDALLQDIASRSKTNHISTFDIVHWLPEHGNIFGIFVK